MARERGNSVNPLNLPNILSLLRLAILPFFLSYLAGGEIKPALFAMGGMILTDVLDGYTARRLNLVSRLGKILDHVVDKIVLLTVSYTLCRVRDLPFWVFYLILLGEAVTLSVSAFLWKKRNVVAQSNAVGRVAGVFSVVTALAYIFEHPYRVHLLYFTLFAMLLSSLNYLRIYLPHILNRRKDRVPV